jgi:hypothetical protein
MSNQSRADLLAVLTELGQRYPDWRFGQLVANVAGWADREIWDVEDEQLLAAGQLHLQQLAPLAATPSPAAVQSNSGLSVKVPAPR